MNATTLYLAIGLGGVGVLLLSARYWVESNTRDLGTMSRQWLVENDHTHP
jgi:hypothetical protein